MLGLDLEGLSLHLLGTNLIGRGNIVAIMTHMVLFVDLILHLAIGTHQVGWVKRLIAAVEMLLLLWWLLLLLRVTVVLLCPVVIKAADALL